MSKYGSNKVQGCFIHIISDRNSAIQITVALMFVKASQYFYLDCTTLGSNYLPGSSILMVQKL